MASARKRTAPSWVRGNGNQKGAKPMTRGPPFVLGIGEAGQHAAQADTVPRRIARAVPGALELAPGRCGGLLRRMGRDRVKSPICRYRVARIDSDSAVSLWPRIFCDFLRSLPVRYQVALVFLAQPKRSMALLGCCFRPGLFKLNGVRRADGYRLRRPSP